MFTYQPPEPPKVRKRPAGSSNQSRVEEVFDNLWEYALPPNPKALLRAQILVKQSNINYHELAKEIISDPGLGLHYLKKISSMNEAMALPVNPVDLLPSLSKDQLSDIFDRSAASISKHDLNNATPAQLLRMQHSFISAKASSSLSSQLNNSISQCFTLNQLAQTTLNLLAWNYPSQFQRALLYKKRYRTDISETLKTLIGVDPKALNNKLVRTLGLPIRYLEDLKVAQDYRAVKIDRQTEIISMVQAGDLLARANDVEHFPEALSQWHQVECEMEKCGIASPRIEIEQEIKDFMSDLGVEHQLPYKSALFNLEDKPEVTNQVSSSTNPHLRKLPQNLQDDFKSIYQIIHKDSFSAAGLKFLVEKMAGSLGVHSGYLYLLKSDNQTLSVSLNFGRIKKPHKMLQLHSNDPIAQSIFSAMPMTLELDDGLILTCCSLQESKKQAVLAMEWDQGRYAIVGEYATALLQAFAYTLVDVMGQRNH